MGLKESNFYFFALAVSGTGISGGDRIFIELARNFASTSKVTIYTSFEGSRLIGKQKLKSNNITLIKISNDKYLGNFLINYLYKIYMGIRLGVTFKVDSAPNIYIYSASEFWMDSFPAILIKLRMKAVKWIAAWYQTAPNPLSGFAEGKRENKYRLSAFYLWFTQLPIRPLINILASKVIVNNESERKVFSKMNTSKNVVVLIGAVKLDEIDKYQKLSKRVRKTYDAVFQGRFHPQKGVLELIEIWKMVVAKNAKAKLAMIGDGPLMEAVKQKIDKYNLEKHIDLFGYVFDGEKKYEIFSKSKIVVHPAFFDSGGIASAEAMAFGIPCVGFDLESYNSYYPKGMQKVTIGDLSEFAKEINSLLRDKEKRLSLGNDAKEMIYKSYSWQNRAKEVYRELVTNNE